MTKIRTSSQAQSPSAFSSCPSQAGAVSLSVKLACSSDYHAHCSQHSPDSPASVRHALGRPQPLAGLHQRARGSR